MLKNDKVTKPYLLILFYFQTAKALDDFSEGIKVIFLWETGNETGILGILGIFPRENVAYFDLYVNGQNISLYCSFQHGSDKHSNMPSDGTVHELTRNVSSSSDCPYDQTSPVNEFDCSI